MKRFRRRGGKRDGDVREEEGGSGGEGSHGGEPTTGSGEKPGDRSAEARRRLAGRVGEARGPKPDETAADGRGKPRRKGTSGEAEGKRSPAQPETAAGKPRRKETSGEAEGRRSPPQPETAAGKPRRKDASGSKEGRLSSAKPDTTTGEGRGKPRRKDASGGKEGRRSSAKPLHRPRPQPREHDEPDGAETRRRRAAERAGRDRDSSRRRRARSDRRRAKARADSLAAALRRGAGAARRRVAVAVPKAGRALLAALGAAFALFFALLGVVLTALIAAGRFVARPIGRVMRALDRAARAASRRATPVGVLALVVAGAAILLALSQYTDYRMISIGNDAYSGVQTVAPAPETGRLEAGDPHSYAFVPVAVACLLLLAAAVAGGRWRLLRLITLAGVAAIVVALVVDRPAGLDPGVAAVSFEGVRASLIGGFYAQIAAGVLLTGSSLLLARELRLAGARRRAPDPAVPAKRLVGRRGATGAPGNVRA